MTSDPKINSTLDEANRLFLLGKLQEAISYYDKILEDKESEELGEFDESDFDDLDLESVDEEKEEDTDMGGDDAPIAASAAALQRD